MTYSHLLTLAKTYAAHVDRELDTIAKRAGVHARVFRRLQSNKGCRHDTYVQAMEWFAANWPADLAWPADVPRPKAPRKEREA